MNFLHCFFRFWNRLIESEQIGRRDFSLKFQSKYNNAVANSDWDTVAVPTFPTTMPAA